MSEHCSVSKLQNSAIREIVTFPTILCLLESPPFIWNISSYKRNTLSLSLSFSLSLELSIKSFPLQLQKKKENFFQNDKIAKRQL